MNSKEFSLTIEGIVKEKKISYMDAVIWYCEENGLDPSQVSSLISKSLKEKIQLEATNLSCLLYTSPSPRDTNPSRMPSSA